MRLQSETAERRIAIAGASAGVGFLESENILPVEVPNRLAALSCTETQEQSGRVQMSDLAYVGDGVDDLIEAASGLVAAPSGKEGGGGRGALMVRSAANGGGSRNCSTVERRARTGSRSRRSHGAECRNSEVEPLEVPRPVRKRRALRARSDREGPSQRSLVADSAAL
jgi:hypothetical protein